MRVDQFSTELRYGNGSFLENVVASFIAYYEVAQETRIKNIPQKSPTVQWDTTPTQSKQITNGRHQQMWRLALIQSGILTPSQSPFPVSAARRETGRFETYVNQSINFI